MFRFIKRFFGLDYNDSNANTHHGVGHSGVITSNTEVTSDVHATVETAVAEMPVVKEKKPRKPVVKKAAPKKTAKKAK
jgi:hypothetical protein